MVLSPRAAAARRHLSLTVFSDLRRRGYAARQRHLQKGAPAPRATAKRAAKSLKRANFYRFNRKYYEILVTKTAADLRHSYFVEIKCRGCRIPAKNGKLVFLHLWGFPHYPQGKRWKTSAIFSSFQKKSWLSTVFYPHFSTLSTKANVENFFCPYLSSFKNNGKLMIFVFIKNGVKV